MSNGEAYPRRIAGYHGDSRCSREQVEFLLRYFPERGSLLEIGSASGTTAAFIADARPQGRVVCVDTYDGLDTFLEVALRLIDWRRNQRPNMTLWLGDAKAIADWLRPRAPFDLAFVDADHSRECTFHCLEAAAALVVPSGRIVVHDWLDPEWPEVEPAVRDFLDAAPWRLASEAPYICALERKR